MLADLTGDLGAAARPGIQTPPRSGGHQRGSLGLITCICSANRGQDVSPWDPTITLPFRKSEIFAISESGAMSGIHGNSGLPSFYGRLPVWMRANATRTSDACACPGVASRTTSRSRAITTPPGSVGAISAPVQGNPRMLMLRPSLFCAPASLNALSADFSHQVRGRGAGAPQRRKPFNTMHCWAHAPEARHAGRRPTNDCSRAVWRSCNQPAARQWSTCAAHEGSRSRSEWSAHSRRCRSIRLVAPCCDRCQHRPAIEPRS